jgi:hypothetical protein
VLHLTGFARESSGFACGGAEFVGWGMQGLKQKKTRHTEVHRVSGAGIGVQTRPALKEAPRGRGGGASRENADCIHSMPSGRGEFKERGYLVPAYFLSLPKISDTPARRTAMTANEMYTKISESIGL